MIAEYVFRCDYCGTHVPIDHAVISYVIDHELDDGSKVVMPAVLCGPYCAQRNATRFGSVRG